MHLIDSIWGDSAGRDCWQERWCVIVGWEPFAEMEGRDCCSENIRWRDLGEKMCYLIIVVVVSQWVGKGGGFPQKCVITGGSWEFGVTN